MRIVESTFYPTTILQVSAQDADSGEWGAVRYRLGGDHHQHFSINATTGRIQVGRNTTLDRETKASYNLLVTVTDTPTGGIQQRKTTVPVSGSACNP